MADGTTATRTAGRPSRWPSTLLRLAVQLAAALALACVVAAIWAAIDGSAFGDRATDAMVIIAAIWLIGGGSMFARITTMEYVQHGLRERAERIRGDGPQPRSESYLTPLAEGFVVAVVVFGASLALSI